MWPKSNHGVAQEALSWIGLALLCGFLLFTGTRANQFLKSPNPTPIPIPSTPTPSPTWRAPDFTYSPSSPPQLDFGSWEVGSEVDSQVMKRLSRELRRSTSHSFVMLWDENDFLMTEYRYVYDRAKATFTRTERGRFGERKPILYSKVTDAAIHAVARRKNGRSDDLVAFGAVKKRKRVLTSHAGKSCHVA